MPVLKDIAAALKAIVVHLVTCSVIEKVPVVKESELKLLKKKEENENEGEKEKKNKKIKKKNGVKRMEK